MRFQTVAWDVSGNCQSPVPVQLMSRPTRRSRLAGYPQGQSIRAETERYSRPTVKGDTPLWLDLETRCRKCANCLRMRSMMWTYRAKSEIADAARTWFGTLTLSPESHYYALLRAEAKCNAKGSKFAELSDDQQFDARHRAISPWLTLYLKRVRKESESPLRYLLVAERHKSGLPHYHALIHEVSKTQPVRHAVLSKQWPHGFSKFKLVTDDDVKTAHYVCKYLSKEQSARVRASLRYGEATRPSVIPEGVNPDPPKSPPFMVTELNAI